MKGAQTDVSINERELNAWKLNKREREVLGERQRRLPSAKSRRRHLISSHPNADFFLFTLIKFNFNYHQALGALSHIPAPALFNSFICERGSWPLSSASQSPKLHYSQEFTFHHHREILDSRPQFHPHYSHTRFKLCTSLVKCEQFVTSVSSSLASKCRSKPSQSSTSTWPVKWWVKTKKVILMPSGMRMVHIQARFRTHQKK